MARKRTDAPRINPKSARNAIAVAKVVGPVVIPVVAPYLVRTTSAVRDRLDRRRARKLGVPVEDLSRFSGKGGALHARIAGAASSLAELREKGGDPAFTDEARTKLDQLAAAVRAAERMPAPRRKAAHRAVVAELDVIERQLLTALGV